MTIDVAEVRVCGWRDQYARAPYREDLDGERLRHFQQLVHRSLKTYSMIARELNDQLGTAHSKQRVYQWVSGIVRVPDYVIRYLAGEPLSEGDRVSAAVGVLRRHGLPVAPEAVKAARRHRGAARRQAMIENGAWR